MQGRRSLISILSYTELIPLLLKSQLETKTNQRKFVSFLKSSFYEALLMKMTSGSKILMKTIKKIIRNVFGYLSENE
jgi:hypothetical protein